MNTCYSATNCVEQYNYSKSRLCGLGAVTINRFLKMSAGIENRRRRTETVQILAETMALGGSPFSKLINNIWWSCWKYTFLSHFFVAVWYIEFQNNKFDIEWLWTFCEIDEEWFLYPFRWNKLILAERNMRQILHDFFYGFGMRGIVVEIIVRWVNCDTKQHFDAIYFIRKLMIHNCFDYEIPFVSLEMGIVDQLSELVTD